MRSSLTDMAMFLSQSAQILFCAPLNSKSPDNIWTKRDASSEHRALLTSTTNITMSPWPTQFYALPLGENFKLVILSAYSYVKRPSPNISPIQEFIRDFADNLEHAYPPPALAPKEAGQSYYDTDSFTKWHMIEWVIPILGTAAPSKIVIAALVQIAREVAKHGSPALVDAIIVGPRGSKEECGFNSLKLLITPLGKGLVGDVVNATSGFASTA